MCELNSCRCEFPLEVICNIHFLRFVCKKSSFISFRRDDWNKKYKKSQPERLYQSMKAYFVDEYNDNLYIDSEYGNPCEIKVFQMNPIFENYLLLNSNLMDWTYPRYPEDPSFYRVDNTCLLHVNVHEELCFYYPRDREELMQLKISKICTLNEIDELYNLYKKI